MKLTDDQLKCLDDALTGLNYVIADVSNGVKVRETSIALTHLETAELWLNNFIVSTPGVQDQISAYTMKKVSEVKT
jgi:hypothetical protein